MTIPSPPRLCDACGHLLDTDSSFDGGGRVPEPGDWSLCVNCGAFSVMHAHGWQPASAAELSALGPEERADLERCREILAMVRRWKRPIEKTGPAH